jgi:hypothetical protein
MKILPALLCSLPLAGCVPSETTPAASESSVGPASSPDAEAAVARLVLDRVP